MEFNVKDIRTKLLNPISEDHQHSQNPSKSGFNSNINGDTNFKIERG